MKPKKSLERKVIRMPKGQSLGTKVHKDRRKETVEGIEITRCYLCDEILIVSEIPSSLVFSADKMICHDCWTRWCDNGA